MRFSKSWAVGAISATVLAMFIPLAQRASAVTPPWEPDTNASNGSVEFYDAAGNRITSGTSLTHLFDYAKASTAATRTTIKAQTTFGFPDHTKPDSTTWFQAQSSAGTIFPNASYPGVLGTTTFPVAHAGASEANLSALLATTTLDQTAGWSGIVQVRLKDSGTGIGNGVLPSPFWATDIAFNTANNTWQQIFPAPPSTPTPTTTTLGAAPSSPQNAGANVTFTATVSPSAAGTVQFKDNGTAMGAAVAVTSGQAQKSTTTLTAGSHTITAEFTPTDSSAFAASVSSGFPYTINSPATTTTTTLGITPASPITVGTTSTLTATVAPSAAGSVTFFDGASAIGSAVAVSSGQAQTTTSFSVNTHNVKAVFTPTDASAFTSSQSAVQPYVVNSAPATPTSTTLGIAPSSPQTFGTPLTFTGTVSPSNAAGTIQFLEGLTVIASGAVNTSTGVATGTSSTLAAGDHSIVAKFVPSNPANFGTSTSSASPFTINKAASTVSLGASPASPRVQGTAVTLTATTGPSGQAGSVEFFDGGTSLGAPVTVVNNQATFGSSAFSVGDHSFTATFTPTSGNFSNSTSTAVPYTIQQPPPGSTTTALTVTPGGPVGPGTVETLRAVVSPSSAPGAVTFRDGQTVIGSAVAVAGGVAQTTTTLAVGDHNLTAEFVPTNPANFASSISATQPYTVKPPATATTTTLQITPSSPITFGTSLTLNATVSPSAAGTVEFFDGATSLGSSPVASGAASKVVTNISGGIHSLTARFHSSAPLDFADSTSAAVPLTVNAVVTTTALAVTPLGPVTTGTQVTLKATVTPSGAAGTVTFKNGTTTLGTAPVIAGIATLVTTTLPQGTASLTAEFTATKPADFGGSVTNPVTLDIVAPPSIDSMSSDGNPIHNGDTLVPGQKLNIDASGFQAGETVHIVVHSSPIEIGTAVADEHGAIHTAVTLPKGLDPGDHTLTLKGAIGSAALTFVVAKSGVSGSGSGGGVANTGTNVWGGAGLGGLLLVGGWLAIEAGSRRRRPGKHRIG